MDTKITRLTKSDLRAIEQQIAHEIQYLGEPPTIESLRDKGYKEDKWLHLAIQAISGFGRITTLLVSELILSVAVLLLLIVFGQLEFWRVYHGALALGQTVEQSGLIGFAVVTANIVHPVYVVRSLRGQAEYQVVRPTLRGWIESFGRRLFARPQVETVGWSHNPTLDYASMLITWTTILLAVYDLIAPLVTSVLTGTATKPTVILVAELIMGLGLSISGVFFLQSASREIAIRLITDQPEDLTAILEEHQQAYLDKLEALRTDVRDSYMQAKLADAERRKRDKEKDKVSASPLSVKTTTGIHQSDNGNVPDDLDQKQES